MEKQSPLWSEGIAQLITHRLLSGHCCLCSPHYSRCSRGYTLGNNAFTHLRYIIQDADWTHYAVICFLCVNCFVVNGNLIRMQPWKHVCRVLFWSWWKLTLCPPLSKWPTLAMPLLFVAGSPGPVSFASTKMPSSKNGEKCLTPILSKHLQPAFIITQLLSSDTVMKNSNGTTCCYFLPPGPV